MHREIQITQMWTHLRNIRLMKPPFTCKNSGLYSLNNQTYYERKISLYKKLSLM